MRSYAFEYTLPSGTTGLIFFASTSINEAVAYTALLCSNYGHINVTNLTPLPPNVTTADLYHLYPRGQANTDPCMSF